MNLCIDNTIYTMVYTLPLALAAAMLAASTSFVVSRLFMREMIHSYAIQRFKSMESLDLVI